MSQELAQIYRRHGKRVVGRPLQLSQDITQKLKSAEHYLETSGDRKPKLRESLDRQLEIVKIIQDAKRVDFSLNYTELLALLALRYDIKREPLFYYANSVCTMVAKDFFSSGDGNAFLRRALQHDLASRVQERVKTYDSPFTALDITAEIGLETDRTSLQMMYSTLNLFEVLKRVIRLPLDSTIKGGSNVWINPDCRYTEKTIPEWNLKYVILLALLGGRSSTINDLVGDERVRSVVSVKDTLGYRYANLYQSLNDLILAGLVDSGVKSGEKRRCFNVYLITTYGSDLVTKTKNDGYLDEELRIALLGDRYEGLKPSERNALIRIKRIATIFAFATIRKGRERRKRGERTDFARRTGEDLKYLDHVIYGGRDPLRCFKEETLRQKFYPYLSEVERRGLETYLQNRR